MIHKLIKRFVAIWLVALFPMAAIAGSSPKVIIDDRVLGINERSLFVLRAITIYKSSNYDMINILHRPEKWAPVFG
jgi:hypothetical protein